MYCISVSHPDFRSDPNGRSELGSGHETIYWDSLPFFFFRAELEPVGIQRISVIKKIIYIHKRTTTEVVSIKIYTYILSPIYLYKYLYKYISNTNIRDRRNSDGEHLSLRWPVLLMWNVLSFLSPLQYLHGLNTRAKLYA